MHKFYAAEAYGNEKAAQWLYDKDGYCEFTEHKIASMLRLAFEAGAASVKKTDALTPIQCSAIVGVIEAYISNDKYDIARMFGLTINEAADRLRVLTRVREKLTPKEQEKINA